MGQKIQFKRKNMIGITLSILEVSLFAAITTGLRYLIQFNVDPVTYYWSFFTVMTMIWECFFIFGYDKIAEYSNQLVETGKHVWIEQYDLTYLLPNKFSEIFYAEYGAYADREYKSLVAGDFWSRLIESSHATVCGVGSLLALIMSELFSDQKFLFIGFAMGGQIINSVLYMFRYYTQMNNKASINYVSAEFPLRVRWFMLVNVFWTVMPTTVMVLNCF